MARRPAAGSAQAVVVAFVICVATLAARGARVPPDAAVLRSAQLAQTLTQTHQSQQALRAEAQQQAQTQQVSDSAPSQHGQVFAAGMAAYDALLERLSVPQELPVAGHDPVSETLVDRVSHARARAARAHASAGVPCVRDYGEDDFDMDESEMYAKLVSVAYCSNSSVIQAWNCTRCRRVPTFEVEAVVFDEVWSLVAYAGYLPNRNTMVAVFRGTDNHQWSNWLENLRFWRHNKMWNLPGAPSDVMVHAGFLNMWGQSSMRANMTAALGALAARYPGAGLAVAGHSMGAALAHFCALEAKAQLGVQRVRSFTYGSPRVGNLAFASFFESQVDVSWRFTHEKDVVPSLPPTLFGYHHTAREVWTLDVQSWDGQPALDVRVCDASGEDLACHNSACMLGLCTSVMDHLHYLQMEMYRKAEQC